MSAIDGDSADGDGVICEVAVEAAGVEVDGEWAAGVIVEGRAFGWFVGRVVGLVYLGGTALDESVGS